jgi:hypothetical protein
MTRLLTKLRISEVSAVDKGAGDGVRILLMKRDDDRRRSKGPLERYQRRLRKFEDIFMRKELDNMETSSTTGATYNRTRRPPDDDVDDDRDDDDDDDIEKQADHHASTVADLLVEAGSFPHRTAALQHLLHKPSGQALLTRMHKAAAKTEKESNMRHTETLESILKDSGPVSVCKGIVERGRSPCGEHELVAALTKAASERHPELSPAQAFAELYKTESVWRACAIAKAMPFVANVEPLMVGGVDATHEAINSTESSEAYAQLKQLGARKWPTATEAQQFANAFTDPVNAALARKAHVRPSATTSYEFPR